MLKVETSEQLKMSGLQIPVIIYLCTFRYISKSFFLEKILLDNVKSSTLTQKVSEL